LEKGYGGLILLVGGDVMALFPRENSSIFQRTDGPVFEKTQTLRIKFQIDVDT
jgi:hypothetical protein